MRGEKGNLKFLSRFSKGRKGVAGKRFSQWEREKVLHVVETKFFFSKVFFFDKVNRRRGRKDIPGDDRPVAIPSGFSSLESSHDRRTSDRHFPDAPKAFGSQKFIY